MVLFSGNLTLCDPYLSMLEAFALTCYTNPHILYFTLLYYCYSWRFGTVGSDVGQIN